MSIIKKIKATIKKRAQNNLSLAIYSVIIACLVWFAISMTLYPSVTKSINNVKIDLDISGSTAAESGLSVINCDLESVDITVKGSRTQVSSFNSDTFTAYIDANNITSPGKKSLTVKVKCNKNIPFEVESISNETVTVIMDKYETREFPITPKLPNVKSVEGKTIYQNEFVCEPSVVNITGPSEQLAKISKCCAFSDKKMELGSSDSLSTSEVRLYAEDGTLIDQSKMTFDTPNFFVNIPVLTQKKVNLVVKIVNCPTEFEKNSIKFKKSTNSLTIATKNSDTEIVDSLDIGTISLTDLDFGYAKTFDISALLEEKGMINMSGVDKISVSLDDTDLAKREFVLDKNSIHMSNKPNSQDFDYELLTQSLPVTVIGPKDIIETLTPADIVADANLLNADMTAESFSYDATITCLTSNKVWSVTKSKVMIQKKKHVEPTTDKESREILTEPVV